MKILGLTSLQYGLSFIFLAFAGATGGILSRLFIGKKSPYKIMKYGSWGVLLSTFFFTLISFIFYFLKVGKSAFIFLALLSMMIIIGSIGMIIPNVLSIALENYKSSIGTASSLFGCLYYALISLITFGMGMCHSGTLFSMPIYFFALSVILYYIMRNFEQL